MSDVEFETDSQNQNPAAYRTSYAYTAPQAGAPDRSTKHVLMIVIIVACFGVTLWLLLGLSRGALGLKSAQDVPLSTKMQRMQLPPAPFQ